MSCTITTISRVNLNYFRFGLMLVNIVLLRILILYAFYYTVAITCYIMALITPLPLFIWLLLPWPLLYRGYYYTVAIIHVDIVLWLLFAWLLWHGRLPECRGAFQEKSDIGMHDLYINSRTEIT